MSQTDDAAAVERVRRLSGPLAVTIIVHPPDLRKRDIANTEKAVCDALTHARVWRDDSQIHELHLYRAGVDRPMGRIDVEIEEIPAPVAEKARGR